MITKLIPWVFSIFLVVALIFGAHTFYTKWQLQNANDALNEQLMAANEELGRAHTSFGSAQDKISKLEDNLRKSLKEHNELLVAYGELEAKYNASSGGSGSGTVEPGQPVDPTDKFEPGMWYLALSEEELMRLENIEIKYSDFRLNVLSVARPTKKWQEFSTDTKYDLHLRLVGQFVQSTTKSGAVNHYLSLWELNDKGEKVGKLELEKFEVVVQKPQFKSLYWWNPKLDIGLFLGGRVKDKLSLFSGASVGLSFSGYGLTKNDLSWKFLHLGADFSSDTIGLSFSPALYNIAENLPLVSNLFLGPYFSLTTDGTKSIGLNLSVGL